MKKSKKEIREIIEKADQERRHRQYQIIQEVDGSLDKYIDSCYCLPDEYLKDEKHINWLNYETIKRTEEPVKELKASIAIAVKNAKIFINDIQDEHDYDFACGIVSVLRFIVDEETYIELNELLEKQTKQEKQK